MDAVADPGEGGGGDRPSWLGETSHFWGYFLKWASQQWCKIEVIFNIWGGQ